MKRLMCASLVALILGLSILAHADYTFTPINYPSGWDTYSYDIDDAGTIVGRYTDASGTHGYSLTGGVYTSINYPGALQTVADGINDAGTIVGNYWDGSVWHGYSLTGGVYTSINYPGASLTQAMDINNSGTITVGVYQQAGEYHGFTLTGGTFTPINYPGVSNTGLQGINNAGVIVGWYYYPEVGFTLTGSAFTLVGYPGAACSTYGINDAGAIVGRYTDSTGTHGFLATPIPEPSPAMAGESPYIAIVDNDPAYKPFYFSPKHVQFLFDQSPTGIAQAAPVCFGTTPPVTQYTRVGAAGCEQFRSQTLNNQAEVCDRSGTGVAPNFVDRGLRNAVTPAGNAGFYEWWIRVPEKPSGEINIVLECGILKPNAFAAYKYGSIELCAAETGERIGFGTCVRQEVDPGVSPVQNIALPKVTAVAYPGPNNVAFAPFHLTSFKNPSAYTLAFDGVTFAMSNNTNSQVLDGSSNARIILKACMDKTIVNKLPVTGQINALGETENDLEAGDLIRVRMDVPRQNSVDIYCHAQSARLAGIGEGF